MGDTPESSGSGNMATDLTYKFSPKVSEKLRDENNYPQWAVEMTRLFRVTELSDYVAGNKAPKPSRTSEIPEWQKKTDRAIMFMIEYCEKEPASYIATSKDAGTAWTTLKSHYEGKTRTHLTALLLAITNLRYDDRKNTISEHISSFETKWLMLAQNVSGTTAGPATMASTIKHFVGHNGWKASMLLSTLPHIPTYQNIVSNITSASDVPSYTTVVLRLKELSAWNTNRGERKNNESQEPAAAFAAYQQVTNPCGYCKSRGYPGTSHIEDECRHKKRNRY